MSNFLGNVAARREKFYGRRRAVAKATRRRWTWICGQRCIGKTSLLRRLEEEFERSDEVALYYEVRKKQTGRGFYESFAKFHRRKFRALGAPLPQPEDSSAESFRELALEIIDRGKGVAFLWDRAERLAGIEKREPGFLSDLAALLKGEEMIRFVLAGTQRLPVTLSGRGEEEQPFLESFTPLPLAGLRDEDARALLRGDQTKRWHNALPDEVVRTAVDWCGGHPYILQLVGSGLEELTEMGRQRPKRSDLAEIFRKIRRDKTVQRILKTDQSHLEPAQHTVLQTLCCAAHQGSTPRQALEQATGLPKRRFGAALRSLQDHGYVNPGDPIALRYGFYPAFLHDEPAPGPGLPDSPKQAPPSPRESAVFLCHNSRDKPEVRELANSFEKNGLAVWMDERNLSLGQPWRRVLEKDIAKAGAAIVCYGRSGLGPVQQQEIDLLCDLATRNGPAIIPVILKSYGERESSPIKGFMGNYSWVDLRMSQPDPLPRLVRELGRLTAESAGRSPSGPSRAAAPEESALRGPSKPSPGNATDYAFSRFEVLVDLRDRKTWVREMPLWTYKTARHIRADLKWAGADVKRIPFSFATEGDSIELVKGPLTAGYEWSERENPLLSPGLKHATGRPHYAELLKKRGRLDRSYDLRVPVEGPGQRITIELIYRGGFQSEEGGWMGNVFRGDADEASLAVLFAHDQEPCASRMLVGNPKRPESFAVLPGANTSWDPDACRLEWRFRKARRGEAYVIEWEW